MSAQRRTIRLATRRSPLALAQARQVARDLAAGGHAVELVEVTTRGDRDPAPLTRIGGTGVFVAAVRQAVLEGRADLAVHSLKDVPTTVAPGLRIAAVPPREDPRDALVSAHPGGLAGLPPAARVGTGSPRRATQLAAVRPDLEVVEIRGNVDSRVARVHGSGRAVLGQALQVDPGVPQPAPRPGPTVPGAGLTGSADPDAVLANGTGLGDPEAVLAGLTRFGESEAVLAGVTGPADLDAVVVAVAGLARLGRREVGEGLDVAVMTPAPGQGALALETRADVDEALAEAMAALDHAETRAAVTAERAVLAALGSGCSAPLGALGRVEGATLHLHAVMADPAGSLVRSSLTGPIDRAESLGIGLARLLADAVTRCDQPRGSTRA